MGIDPRTCIAMTSVPYTAAMRRHDRLWAFLMVFVIAMGVAMPFPFNVLQTALGGVRLVSKILRLMEREP